MAGRKPKPTALKVLSGNAGKRAINKNEPTPPVEIPDCPPHLDAEAQAEWKRISVILDGMRVLTAADKAALTVYCQSWSRMVEAESKIAENGTVVKSPNGYPIQNPYLAIANAAIKQLMKILVEFGLSPASRSKIQTAAKDDADPMDEFLSGKD